MTNIIAIDPSLNSTGVAYRDAKGNIKSYCVGFKNLKGLGRIQAIRNAIDNALTRFSPEVVVYEGYAVGFRGKSNTLFDLGELGGVVKLLILEKGIDIFLVSPNSLKLFVTGKGNADKKEVALALEEELGVKFSTSDQYDAAGLLMMGEAKFLGGLTRDGKTFRRRALQGGQRLKAIEISCK